MKFHPLPLSTPAAALSPLATLAYIFSKPRAAWTQKHHQERAGLL